jgi:ribosomal protein S30
VLTLEWENFDPRVYNHEQYKRRLELFKVMLSSRTERRRSIT